jgi:hypothetical protein
VLNLYRRHTTACEGKHAEDSHPSEFDERKRSWKSCECTICVSGTLAGSSSAEPRREPPGMSARRGGRLGAWRDRAVARDGCPGRFRCCARTHYHRGRCNRLPCRAARHAERGPASMSKYRTLATQLTAFADGKGYVYLDQFTTIGHGWFLCLLER